MDSVSIMSGLAVQGAFESTILPEFERTAGIRAEMRWDPTTVIMAAIAGGERADIVVLVDKAIDELAERGIVTSASRRELAAAVVGIAVRKGDTKPDISTTEAFRRTLLDARSVAYSKGGASGIYFETLIERLGIADAIRAKATVIPAGFTAERLVTGEADIAIQQISELMVIDGVDIVGPFPGKLQTSTMFTAAVFADCSNPRGAELLMNALTSREAREAYRASGLVI